MNQLNRIQYLSQNFSELQGFKNIPIWIATLVFAIAAMLRTREIISGSVLIIVSVLAVGVAAYVYWRIQAYYSENYGNAKSRSDNKDSAFLILGVILEPITQQWMISIFGLFAAIYCYRVWRKGTFRKHYLVFSIILVIFSLSAIYIPGDDRVPVTLIFVSLLNLAGSFLDHLMLTNMLEETRGGNLNDEPV